jgi:N-sulfoglucosamine sulfohydrolase
MRCQADRIDQAILRHLLRPIAILLLGCTYLLFTADPAVCEQTRVSRDSPNIILIIADDLGWEDCGPYGNRAVRTPALDRLAKEGLRGENFILTCSSCSPSRSSIITGRYPHSTGAEQLHWPLPKEQTTFVEQLKAAGYYTAAAGKWHLGNAVKNRFDLVAEVGSEGFQLPTDAKDVTKKKVGGKNPSGCEAWVPVLKEVPQDRPFFLWLAAVDPHRDYQAGAVNPPHDPAAVVVPPYLPDTPEVRQDFALYYDEIARLDSFVEKVLDELDRQKLSDNTLVLFVTDNGRPFPRCKTTLYDSGIKSPFLARWPKKIKPGATTKNLLSSVDIGPTLLELVDVQPPASFQGQSFAKLLEGNQHTTRKYAFAEHNWHDYEARGRSVRTTDFKYIRNEYFNLPNTPPADAVRSPTFAEQRRLFAEGKLPREQATVFYKPLPREELYDLQADPHELKNLVDDPARHEILAELRKALDEWKADTVDTIPEERTPDEFDRETGEPLPGRKRPRVPAVK